MQVQLKRGMGIHVDELKERLRERLAKQKPGVRFSFEPSDIVSRVMSFGAPTPIEVAVAGTNFTDVRRYAGKLDGSAAMNVWLHEQVMIKVAEVPEIIRLTFGSAKNHCFVSPSICVPSGAAACVMSWAVPFSVTWIVVDTSRLSCVRLLDWRVMSGRASIRMRRNLLRQIRLTS